MIKHRAVLRTFLSRTLPFTLIINNNGTVSRANWKQRALCMLPCIFYGVIPKLR